MEKGKKHEETDWTFWLHDLQFGNWKWKGKMISRNAVDGPST